MATSARPQAEASLSDYARAQYALGDFLEDFGHGRSVKLRLTTCPLCATDPTRRPYHFRENESRAAHFETAHDATDC